MIDLEWIRQVIDMVDESGIDSLEVSRLGTRVRIRKSPPVRVSEAPAAGAAGATEPAGAPPSRAGADGRALEAVPEETEPPVEKEAAADHHEISSPMVGTFYRAPAPDAPPYVEVGDRVQEGQTLCILEAMKLMNELESEVRGIVREICVQNSEPVEYGQLLFRVETDGAAPG